MIFFFSWAISLYVRMGSVSMSGQDQEKAPKMSQRSRGGVVCHLGASAGRLKHKKRVIKNGVVLEQRDTSWEGTGMGGYGTKLSNWMEKELTRTRMDGWMNG